MTDDKENIPENQVACLRKGLWDAEYNPSQPESFGHGTPSPVATYNETRRYELSPELGDRFEASLDEKIQPSGTCDITELAKLGSPKSSTWVTSSKRLR